MTEALARMTPERRSFLFALGGGLLAFVVAVVLFTRFSLDDNFWRDEAIYAYGGQQLADGVPVYSGIFDPKPPLPTFLNAFAVLSARAVDKNDLTAMRAEFFVFAPGPPSASCAKPWNDANVTAPARAASGDLQSHSPST